MTLSTTDSKKYFQCEKCGAFFAEDEEHFCVYVPSSTANFTIYINLKN